MRTSNRLPCAQLTIARLPDVSGGWRYSAECDASVSTVFVNAVWPTSIIGNGPPSVPSFRLSAARG